MRRKKPLPLCAAICLLLCLLALIAGRSRAQPRAPEDAEAPRPPAESAASTAPAGPEACPEPAETATQTPAPQRHSLAAGLPEAAYADGIILISAPAPEEGTFSFHKRSEDGVWRELLSGRCYVGYNGLGKTAEGDGKTPAGTFALGLAFGNEPDPGAAVAYLQTDDSHYWVDDPGSAHYNRLVSTDDTERDWSSAEHIADFPEEYAYAVNIEYNPECVPGKGSAIFLHCDDGHVTSGCIAISRENMIELLRSITPETVIVIG